VPCGQECELFAKTSEKEDLFSSYPKRTFSVERLILFKYSSWKILVDSWVKINMFKKEKKSQNFARNSNKSYM